MKTVNSHYLKLSGKSELPKELEIGNNYSLAIHGSITSVTEHDNQDGTVDRAYKFEPIRCEILTELGEVIKAKDTRGEGQKTRAWAYKYWQETNTGDMDFDTFYHKFQVICRTNLEELSKLIK